MNQLLALAGKDLKLLQRDTTGLLFILGVPLLFAVFFGSLFGGESTNAISIAVVDLDQSEASAAFVASLRADEALEVETDRLDAATERVRRGDLVAALIIPESYGSRQTGVLTGDGPELELLIDPSRGAEAGMLRGIITRRAMEQFVTLFDDPSVFRPQVEALRNDVAQDDSLAPADRLLISTFLASLDFFLVGLEDLDAGAEGSSDSGLSMGFIDITVDHITADTGGPTSPFEVSFPQGIVWGLISVVMTFATGLVTERTLGTLIRIRIAPVSTTQLLAGKAIACFAASAGVMVAVLSVGVVAFGVSPDSWLLLGLALVCVSVCMVGIMLLFATLGRTERSVSNVGWAIMMVLAMAGGGMVPLFAMPEWMLSISHLSPIKWSVFALEGALWRGFTLSEMALPCLVLIGVGAVCFGLGVRSFRRQGFR